MAMPRQLGVGPRLIQEDQPRGLRRRLALVPDRPLGFYRRPGLLVGMIGLFLHVRPCFR